MKFTQTVDLLREGLAFGSIYCCPKCKEPVYVQNNSESGSGFSCDKCKGAYPVLNGVPRFVSSDQYLENFSFEWKTHQRTQFDTDRRQKSFENFYLRFGKEPAFFGGKRVLDVGIGSGRYAEIPLRAGAEVWGVDLSFAIDVAQKNLGKYPQFHGAQADVFNLPFPKESFDIIYSFGVLHHTPDPKKAFEALIPLLKPGGCICITVYQNWGMYHTSRFLRKFTTKLPPKLLYFLTTVFTLVFYYPYRYFGLSYGILGRVAPISMSDSLREAVLDTFDCYSPTYQFTYGTDEVFTWFKQQNLKNIEPRPQPVTVIGYK